MPVINPLHHLLRPEPLFAELFGEKAFQTIAVKIEQIDFGRGVHVQRALISVAAKK
jgi:hypothetical protein